jgi:threonine synthase
MEYISTRGSAPAIPSRKAILKGIAEDSGLYVPSQLPLFGDDPFAEIDQDSYAGRAFRILKPFLPDYSPADLSLACKRAYAENFDSPQTAPVRFLDDGTAVLELWHGPTQAFKDMALQIMPLFLSTALRGEETPYELVILVATSGDTGKAALEGFADVPGVRILVFYPHEGVSRIQRLQMVTQRGRNVGVCAVRGNFDDAQNGVKRIFGESALNARLESAGFRLSSANSINWGRLAPQIVYYFTGYQEMVRAGKIRRGQKIPVCVPTGNFGNILAAYYASRCGLPVSRLICASNRNKVLADFINTGTYDRRREFFKTESPSMDILISSNLERLLFELCGKDSAQVLEWMGKLNRQGSYSIPGEFLRRLRGLFYGGFADPGETLKAIRLAFERQGYLMDPHTAVGYWVLQEYRRETGDETPALLTSTASPFKFPQAVLEALGRDPGDRDEFVLLQELGGLGGVAVPSKLAELKVLPELHPGVCAQNEMAGELYRFLGMTAS